MDVVIEISDPWELTRDDGPTLIRGTITQDLSELSALSGDGVAVEVHASPSQELAGNVVRRVTLQARYTGASFAELGLDDGIIVNGEAFITGMEVPLRFIGVARRSNAP